MKVQIITFLAYAIAMVFLFTSYFYPWNTNTYEMEGYKITHGAGLIYYEMKTDFDTYSSRVFVHYHDSSSYFEGKPYTFNIPSMKFIFSMNLFQTLILIFALWYSLFNIFENAVYFQRIQIVFTYSWWVYIGLTIASLPFIISPIVAGICATTTGYHDDSIQDLYNRGVGLGFCFQLMALLLQLSGSLFTVIYLKFCNVKESSETYTSF
ncbi:Uncharacterized protein QTN25_007775 [Entamoeba marina]